ncbi:MAG TPA: hypothetical protein VIL30_18090 [Ramlibacter sp.]|jgi:hypothetical protein
MTHKRQRIREAVVAVLSGIPDWQGRVFANRARPTEQKELPVTLVYSLAEESEAATIGRTLMRRLTIAIELRTSVLLALDDALDDFAEKAEQAMAADPRLGKRAIDSTLVSTTLGLDGEGDSRQAIATLTYSIKYQTDGNGN